MPHHTFGAIHMHKSKCCLMVTLLGFLLAHLGLVVCFSSVVEDLKKDYAVIVYYLGLYEEGEVEHTNNFTHPFPLIFHTC